MSTLLILISGLGVSMVNAQTLHSPDLETKLTALSKGTKQILFVDIDNTLGLQNEHSGQWMLYDGALDFLREQGHFFTLVLFTANIRDNIDRLLEQYPILRTLTQAVITVDDFAPRFSDLVHQVTPEYKKINQPTTADWRGLLFSTFLKNPSRYLPPGVVLNFTPTDLEEWRHRVYFPYLSPDKSGTVIRYDGLLLDDRFAGIAPEDRNYEKLVAQKRAFYEGAIGGSTPDSGPDYPAIALKLKTHRESCGWLL